MAQFWQMRTLKEVSELGFQRFVVDMFTPSVLCPFLLCPLSFPSLLDKKADFAWEVQPLSCLTLRKVEQEDRGAWSFMTFCNLKQFLLPWNAYLQVSFYGRKINSYIVKLC